MAIKLRILVEQLLQHHQDQWQLQLLAKWPSIIGKLKSKVILEKIQHDGIIIVSVLNSSWLQELYLLSNVLIQRINQSLEKPYIKQIRFRLIEKKEEKKIARFQQSSIIYNDIPLNFKESDALKKIHDEQLSNALKKFLIRCHNSRRML